VCLVKSSEPSQVSLVDLTASLKEMLDNLHTSLAMVTSTPSPVCCSINCQVEWAVSMVSQAVDVSHGGQGGHQLQAARQAGAVEDGEVVCKHWGVHVQVVVVDDVEHQGDVGWVLAGLLGLGTDLYLKLGYQLLVGD